MVFHFTERKRHEKIVQENSTLQIMLRAGPGDLVQNTEKLGIFQDEKEIEEDISPLSATVVSCLLCYDVIDLRCITEQNLFIF